MIREGNVKVDRLNDMEQYILQTGTSSLEELCRHYGVSMSTIRRDVGELIHRNRVEKVYGGVARSQSCAAGDLSALRQAQTQTMTKSKGYYAASFVRDGMSVFLDSGAAGLDLLPHLAGKRNITVISHSLTVLSEATRFPSLNVIALGGIYNSVTASFSGNSVLNELAKMSIDLVFLTADGVSAERGLTSSSYTEIEVKKNVAKWNRDLILLADGCEFGQSALITFCELRRLRAIVSEKPIPAEFAKANALNKIALVSAATENEKDTLANERSASLIFDDDSDDLPLGVPTAAM